MPVYRLTPVLDGRDNAAWARSAFQGTCHVSAPDEDDARALAHRRFGLRPDSDPARGLVPASPWQNPALVECVRIDELAGRPPPFGTLTIVEPKG